MDEPKKPKPTTSTIRNIVDFTELLNKRLEEAGCSTRVTIAEPPEPKTTEETHEITAILRPLPRKKQDD